MPVAAAALVALLLAPAYVGMVAGTAQELAPYFNARFLLGAALAAGLFAFAGNLRSRGNGLLYALYFMGAMAVWSVAGIFEIDTPLVALLGKTNTLYASDSAWQNVSEHMDTLAPLHGLLAFAGLTTALLGAAYKRIPGRLVVVAFTVWHLVCLTAVLLHPGPDLHVLADGGIYAFVAYGVLGQLGFWGMRRGPATRLVVAQGAWWATWVLELGVLALISRALA